MNNSFGNPFSTNPQFGSSSSQTTPSFNISGGFGASSGSLFGATTSSLFGNPPNNNSVRPVGGVFGGNTSSTLFQSFAQASGGSAFGQSSIPGFNSSAQPAAFGPSPSQSNFGQNTGFGNAPNSLNRFGAFGSTPMGGDGSQGTYGIPFEKVLEPDSSQTSRNDGGGRSYLMSVAAMRQFINESPETLRSIDYKKGHKKQSRPMQSGFGGSNPSTGLFSGNTGGGYGMSGSSTSMFGGGFGSTPQSSGGLFGQTGNSRFGFGTVQTSPGFGTGTGYGAASASLFGGPTTSAFGAPSHTTPSLFSNQTGGSMFGQQSTASFVSGFGQGGMAPANNHMFGTPSSTGSLFGRTTSAGFGASPPQTGTLFGNPTSGAFSFGTTSSGIFNNQQTGAAFFSQPQTTGGTMFPFQSSASLFGTGQATLSAQTVGLAFGPSRPNTGQQQSSIFAPQPTAQQPVSTFAPQNFFAVAGNQDPSTHPHWTPAYGIVAPNLSNYQELLDGQSKLEKVDRFDYIKGKGSKVVSVPYPVRFVLEEKGLSERNKQGVESDWSWASVAKPPEPTMEEKLEKWIQNVKKSEESSGNTSSASGVLQSAMTQNSRDSDRQQAIESLVQAEGTRRNSGGIDQLTREEIESLCPKISDSEYYLLPTNEGLISLAFSRSKESLKSVHGVEIGRRGYGKIIFTDPLNVEKLDVNKSIVFKRGFFQIPEGSPLKGLPATVCLFRVFFKSTTANTTTRSLENDADFAEKRNRAKMLCEQHGHIFNSYERDGTWKFTIT